MSVVSSDVTLKLFVRPSPKEKHRTQRHSPMLFIITMRRRVRAEPQPSAHYYIKKVRGAGMSFPPGGQVLTTVKRRDNILTEGILSFAFWLSERAAKNANGGMMNGAI